MRWVYNILFTIGFLLSSPYYFLKMRRRGQWKEGFGERFGRYGVKIKQAVTNSDILWMHAVSVGEVNLCTNLIRAIEPRVPLMKIMVSTTTSTGMGELQKKLPGHVGKFYYPIDLRSFVRRALLTIRPKAVVLVEAEIWPNFLWRARDRGTPVFLVNARLSERSFRGYKRAGFLFRPLFRSLAGVGAQNEADAARLVELGCRPEVVRVVGSLKFDAVTLEERRLVDVTAIFRQLGIEDDAPVLIGGSTHAGEEAILYKLAKALRARFPKLFLVLVPRHFERCREVGRELDALGARYVYRSDVLPGREPVQDRECLIVNTTGELKYFYEHASVIFVGKSLCGEGGQNPIEPGAMGKAMVFGPNMQNFAAIVASFLAAGGARQVRSSEELASVVGELLANPTARETLGRNALRVVRQNQGAIERTVDMILGVLHGEEHEHEHEEEVILPAVPATTEVDESPRPNGNPAGGDAAGANPDPETSAGQPRRKPRPLAGLGLIGFLVWGVLGGSMSMRAEDTNRAALRWLKAMPSVPELTVPADVPGWEQRRGEIRSTLWRLLGDLPPRPAKPAVRVLSSQEGEGYRLEKFVFDNLAGAEVPGYLFLPSHVEGKIPAILYCHWHGGEYDKGKIEMLEANHTPEAPGPTLARLGFAVLGVDAYCFGERNGEGPGGVQERGTAGEMTASKFNLWAGRTLWGMILRDDLMALDYLVSRPEVDASRVGVTGISMGATRSWWLMALDDRIKAGVAVACLTRYQDLVASEGLRHHGIYFFVPGLLRNFDTEAIVALAAPRPLLVMNGDSDDGSPVSGIKTIESRVRPVYDRYGKSEQFKSLIFEKTGHVYRPEMWAEMQGWFVTHLKSGG